jgi:tyrosine-specific transport protein
LGAYLHNHTILTFGQAFSFFAMTTSFLGISLAFVDFLADGLKLRKKPSHKFWLCLFIFGLPLLITWINPHLFITTLSLAGGFGVALLLGAIPILMVWAGRYFEGHSLLHQQLPGGKLTLSLLTAFVVMELIFTF